MIQHLKNLYPTLIQLKSPQHGYIDFLIDGKLYGIPEHLISEDAWAILSLFIDQRFPDQDQWELYLTGERSTPPQQFSSFRILLLYIKDSSLTQAELNEILSTILNTDFVAIQHTNQRITIIEPIQEEQWTDFNEIIETLSDDLTISLKLFQSPILNNIEDLPEILPIYQSYFFPTMKQSLKGVVELPDLLLPKMIMSLTDSEKEIMYHAVLGESIYDSDLLKTIEFIITKQFNISLVAKELYMHRNTVQNRLDRFTQLTGLDLSLYEDQLKAYFAIQFFKNTL